MRNIVYSLVIVVLVYNTLSLSLVAAIPQEFIVCPANYCDKVNCSEYIDENLCKKNGGELVPHSSNCECCSTCTMISGPGDTCSLVIPVRGGYIRNVTYLCQSSYSCSNGVCTLSP